MIFSEKLIALRKQRGMSQEELAEMLDVTRQSVSKWESGQSMPDISKIVLMSEIFSVSTDDLLKDDIAVLCGPDTSDMRDEAIKVSADKAEEYMMYSKYQAKMYAAATALCIFSPAPLIFLLADAGFGRLPASVSVILGLLALFIFVACGTSMFIYTSIKNQQYKYLDEQSFILDKSAREKTESLRTIYSSVFARNVIIGVVLCIFAAVPVIVFSLFFAEHIGIGVCLTLLLVIIAVTLFVYSGTIWSAFQKLLGLGDYSPEGKRAGKLADKIGGIYWPAVVVIYLAYSLISNDWGRSWIVWPVSGVLFAALIAVAEAVADSKHP